MTIHKNLTPFNKWDGRRGDSVEWIVLHYTANTWQPDLAKNECAVFAQAYYAASAHFFVDQTEIWQSVAVDDTAWHCGDAPSRNGCRNTNSIGIEMCVVYKDGVYSIPEETVDLAAELVRELLKAFPDAKLCRHYDVTGKVCPEPWVREPALWDDFLEKVKEEPMTKEEKKEFDELKKTVEAQGKTIEDQAARIGKLTDALTVMGRDVNKIDVRTEPKYMRVEDCPKWLRPTIQKLVDKKYLIGDENGNLELTNDLARGFTVNDRAGVYGE